MLATMGIGGLSCLLPEMDGRIAEAAAWSEDANTAGEDWRKQYYGTWTCDDQGLPAFDANLENDPAPYASFSHLMSTGTVGALADRWGNIKLITTEKGPVCLTPTTGRTRSGLYAMLETGGELYSLIYSELPDKKSIRYGAGYIVYHGELSTEGTRLAVTQEVYAPPDKSRVLRSQFTFCNAGKQKIVGRVSLCSDVWIHPGIGYDAWIERLQADCGSGLAAFRNADDVLGDVFFITDPDWQGSNHAHSLILSRSLTLQPEETLMVCGALGYGRSADLGTEQRNRPAMNPQISRRLWSLRLWNVQASGSEEWMKEECRWSVSQLFAFENYDRILAEHYLHLGGYTFFPDPDNPRPNLAFTVREAAQNALAISGAEPALAKSTLRWLAKMQVASGDIPKNYNFTCERLDIDHYEKDSDTEIWFLMALCEYLDASGDMACLDESLSWFPEGASSLWDHAQRAFMWITEGIGVGRHGLIRILDGDWNDYLSTVGVGGQGESVMNSGMAAKTFDSLARIARKRGDTKFASTTETWRDTLRQAVGKAFDTAWFAGCYSDEGRAIAGYGDRLYLNSQSWAVLGRCGSREQRVEAMKNAVRECQSRIGLTLISKPYSSPAPPNISWCPIPRGEGENGGVWPQTAYWAVWALAEEGLFDLAMDEWKKATLRNHSKSFPEVPYGIYNAPDCWSSRLAGRFEGWTQYNQFHRATPCPMSPMIAWQAFTLRRIDELRKEKGNGEQDRGR